MKIAAIVIALIVIAACAFAQPSTAIDVPRVLAEHNIKAAEALPGSLKIFRDSIAELPVAIADMGNAILCTKQEPITDQCIAVFRAAVDEFHFEWYGLRWSREHAAEVLHEIELDIIAATLVAEKKNRFEFTHQEEIAVQQYLARENERLNRSFAAAEKQWWKTWHRAKKVLEDRRFKK
jgi:hypothetical protein